MPYTTYKILHIVCLLLTTSFLSVSFLCTYNEKWIKITSGIVSLLILVTGFGLLAKLGFNDVSWPLWVKIKLTIWLLIAGGAPVLAKRLTKNRGLAFVILMGLFGLATAVAVLKP
ncbi:MAG: putative membrane protein SirB2 [Candidatus Omnitrophota bacterium]|jgi:uncharacterized membrane protein SirB2